MSQSHYPVSPDFPYESKYLDISGAKMHYVEKGEGDPILFLHGIPTSNYLWRNIMPPLSSQYRCIAPDLMGMGKSDKSRTDSSVFNHIQDIENFINALNLSNLTIVMHGWGSVIGFDYAMRNESKIKGLAFLESHFRVIDSWDDVSLPAQELLKTLNSYQDGGRAEIVENNFLLDQILPNIILRKLTDKELNYYREPFSTPSSRKILWQYIQELPLPNGSQPIKDLIENYSKSLQKSQIPKLLMYSVPGFMTSMSSVKWASANLPKLKMIDLGDALHCPQETNPKEVSQALVDWRHEIQ